MRLRLTSGPARRRHHAAAGSALECPCFGPRRLRV